MDPARGIDAGSAVSVDTAEPTGLLELAIATREGRSYARHQRHSGTLRVLRPHYLDSSGQVTYTVLNPGGAFFGGDRYQIDVLLDRAASVMLSTQSATKVYRTPQGPASQSMQVYLGASSVFEYLPDQLIMYREASYRQRTVVRMHPTATVVMAEIITPGWSPDGGQFAFDELRVSTDILVDRDGDEILLASDRLRLVPAEGVRGLGVMEGFSHSGQLMVATPSINDALFGQLAEIVERMSADMGGLAGITRAGAQVQGETPDAVVIRTLGNRTGDIAALHIAVVDALREARGHSQHVYLRKTV